MTGSGSLAADAGEPHPDRRGTVVAFFVPGVPQPQGSKTRIHHVTVDDNRERLAPWRDSVVAVALDTRSTRQPLTGPCRVEIAALFCRPKAHYGTGRNATLLKASAPVFHAQKPDADKVARAILDALTTAKVWLDDQQAFEVTVRRRWVDRWEVGGAHIRVEETP